VARRPKPNLRSLTEVVTGAVLKAFLDWVDATLDDKPSKRLEIVTITRSAYTLTQYDAGKYLRFTSACTLTVPPAGSVPLADGSKERGSFTVGDVFHLRSVGGQLTFSGGTGVAVWRPVDTNALSRGERCSTMLVYYDDNSFDLLGDLELA
jgi:hypothetical protein